MVYNCTSYEEFKQVISKGKSIVKFTASWCNSSRFISLYFEIFARRYKNIKYIKVDIDEVKDVTELSSVYAIPAFHCYEDGVLMGTFVGANAKKLEEFIRKESS